MYDEYDYRERHYTRYNRSKNRKYSSKTSYVRIGNKQYISTDSKNERINKKPTFSFIKAIFTCALVIIVNTLFFSGYFSSSMLANEHQESFNHTINGVNYEYQVDYIDYNWEYKLNQLQAFRNVFTIESFVNEYENMSQLRVPNPNYFMEGEKYHDDSYIVGKMIEEGIVLIAYGRFEYNNTNYGYYYLEPQVLIIPDEYYFTYNCYVNELNRISWVEYQKRIINEGEMWYDDIVKAFNILNAPIIWGANIIYDLGVIVNFIINW